MAVAQDAATYEGVPPPARDSRSSERRLRVVVVDEELPFPLVTGKRIRTFNLLTRLGRRHRVIFACHRNADPSEAKEGARALEEAGIEVRFLDDPVVANVGTRFLIRLVTNLFSPLPFTVETHVTRHFSAALEETFCDDEVDIWHCEWSPYAAAAPKRSYGRLVVMAHNVESLIWQRYTETESNPLKRAYIRHQWRKFEDFERWAFSVASRTIVVSADDGRIAAERFGAAAVQVVDNGVDIGYFRPPSEARGTDEILFLGSLDYRPNQDAVRLLIDHIFPQVLEHRPNAKLFIVGRKPPRRLVEAAATAPGVILHADVPDVRPFLQRCSVMAVPLRIGGGSRLKILEGLASGIPVVSTRVGAEGLEIRPREHFVQVDDVTEMSEAILQVLRHPDGAKDMTAAGLALVTRRYGWEALTARLEAAWVSVAETAEERSR